MLGDLVCVCSLHHSKDITYIAATRAYCMHAYCMHACLLHALVECWYLGWGSCGYTSENQLPDNHFCIKPFHKTEGNGTFPGRYKEGVVGPSWNRSRQNY
jgi:hypothetical protein